MLYLHIPLVSVSERASDHILDGGKPPHGWQELNSGPEASFKKITEINLIHSVFPNISMKVQFGVLANGAKEPTVTLHAENSFFGFK